MIVREIYQSEYTDWLPPPQRRRSVFSLTSSTALAGMCALLFAGTAALKGIGKSTGTDVLGLGSIATVRGTGKTAGTTACTMGSAASAKGLGKVAGAGRLISGNSAAVRGTGKALSTATFTIGNAAVARATGRISAANAMRFGGSGAANGVGKNAGNAIFSLLNQASLITTIRDVNLSIVARIITLIDAGGGSVNMLSGGAFEFDSPQGPSVQMQTQITETTTQ